MKRTIISVLLLSLTLAGFREIYADTKTEVLGIKVAMKREDARRQLQKIGRLEKEERKQQEIWTLTNDRHYAYLIVAFDKENTKVRYFTAKAREGGQRIRYSDVVDIKKARQVGTVNNYKYVLDVPGHGKHPGYTITARGTDPQYLTYFSIELLD